MATSTAASRLRVVQGHLTGKPTKNQTQSPEFRYTLNDTVLTEQQRAFYEENGFLVFRKLVPDHHLDVYSQRFRDICEGRADPGRIAMIKDVSLVKSGRTGERLYNKLQDFMWDDVFFEYISCPQVVDLAVCFTGPNLTAVHTMLINKPPDAGTDTSRHPLHQDLHYFPFRPADRIVCSWTAMEKVTRENGCLVVLPGTHKGTLLPHEYPKWENGVNKMYHGVIGQEDKPRVHLEMEKGDTVFFHPILIHGSGANRTKGFRKAISCHYAASGCNYIDVRGTSQENIATEVEEIALKRGIPSDYVSIWRYRARVVRGEMGNLALNPDED